MNFKAQMSSNSEIRGVADEPVLKFFDVTTVILLVSFSSFFLFGQLIKNAFMDSFLHVQDSKGRYRTNTDVNLQLFWQVYDQRFISLLLHAANSIDIFYETSHI